MRLFIDSGAVEEVEEIATWGVLSGATTNPTLLAKLQADPGEAVRRICELVDGPVSVEVVAEEWAEMLEQGLALAELHEHVVVKVPFGASGLKVTRALSDRGIGVNVTLIFSPAQAVLAAEAGARYVSCFMGRLDDCSIDSAEVLAGIVSALRGQDGSALVSGDRRAQVLAASIRHPVHAITAARLGCDVATIPGKVLRQMLVHPLTEAGIESFAADWRSRPELGAWLERVTATRDSVGAPAVLESVGAPQ